MGKRKELHLCINCYKNFYPEYSSLGKYCSNKCQGDFVVKEKFKKIESGEVFHHKVMKKYLISTFGNKCLNPSCGWDWNKECRVEMEHIDGNSENNNLNNLTFLCPNCHSNTPTYGNKNRGNGRKIRRDRYQKGLTY